MIMMIEIYAVFQYIFLIFLSAEAHIKYILLIIKTKRKKREVCKEKRSLDDYCCTSQDYVRSV